MQRVSKLYRQVLGLIKSVRPCERDCRMLRQLFKTSNDQVFIIEEAFCNAWHYWIFMHLTEFNNFISLILYFIFRKKWICKDYKDRGIILSRYYHSHKSVVTVIECGLEPLPFFVNFLMCLHVLIADLEIIKFINREWWRPSTLVIYQIIKHPSSTINHIGFIFAELSYHDEARFLFLEMIGVNLIT